MPTVAQFLVERLENSGVRHVFGVPGEYISCLFKKISGSPIKLVSCADEAGAGFAADAYARIMGVGCVAVTYHQGAFKLINAAAAASVEKSPLIIISGAPGIEEHDSDPSLRHMKETTDCQRNLFDRITCASTVLDDPNKAGYEIDRVLASMQYYKQPIYIELPADIADKSIAYDVYKQGTPTQPKTDNENLEEALQEVREWVNNAKKPVILAGVEIARFEMGTQLQKFSEKTNIPIAVTMLSKSVIQEKHPNYLGVYSGDSSREEVQKAVEESDCLLIFGVMAGDSTLSHFPASFKKRKVIYSTIEELKIKNHAYKNVGFKAFLEAVFRLPLTKKNAPDITRINRRLFTPDPEAKLSVQRVFDKLDSILDANSLVVADGGTALSGSSELMVHHNHAFLGHALYKSRGTAIPGALGAGLARPTARLFVIVGDGAFQTSVSELGTIVAQKIKPIVLVLNNHCHATENLLCEGQFNNVSNWNYSKVVEMVGGRGFEVSTEGELDRALSEALRLDVLCVFNIELSPTDTSILNLAKKD
jgi:TPP-dependent 2-oxoacid decarboxylase